MKIQRDRTEEREEADHEKDEETRLGSAGVVLGVDLTSTFGIGITSVLLSDGGLSSVRGLPLDEVAGGRVAPLEAAGAGAAAGFLGVLALRLDGIS